MKRWLTLAALAVMAAACNDAQPLAPERAPGGPNALLGLPATVSVDPVLANTLRLAGPAEQIAILVTYDSAASGDAVAGAVRAATTAGIVRFKHLPIVFTLVYVARREWGRAALSLVVAIVLVAPMPLLGWDPSGTNPGESLSLFHLASPAVWVTVAAVALAGAVLGAWRYPRYVGPGAAAAAILALPRLLLYDLTYVLVGTEPLDG